MEGLNIVRFAQPGRDSFHDTISTKVSAYFRVNKISPYANREMWFKTGFMLLLYFVPFFLMAFGAAGESKFFFFLFWILMALGMVGIGTSVMHDANHGTYSPNKKVNTLIGTVLEVIGGYAVSWKIQHNYLHHTYTNIAGLDEDIDNMFILRFSPHHKRRGFHGFQHLYVWFFYMLMTLYWMTFKDYVQVIRYRQHDLLVKEKVSLPQAIFRITIYKIFYYSYIIVLPITFSGMPWYFVVIGFLLMHFTAGLID